MINPHGSTTLNPLIVRDQQRCEQLVAEAQQLPELLLNSAAAANVVMLGAGYFNPLTGFMNLDDALSCAENMHTSDGLFWPVPIINLCATAAEIPSAGKVALRDPNVVGHPVIAIMDVDRVEPVSREQLEFMAVKIFATDDLEHPGVATFMSLGSQLLSGTIEVLNLSYFQSDFPDTFQTAYEIRAEIAQRGWEKVVAFQTRNPMHRAHEELCHMAMKRLDADGVIVHMLLGRLKPGDIPADVRNDCIRKMVEVYFPKNSVMVSGYGFDMLYAGPREAVLHAIFRQNMGATHLIVGRDHAGVGEYYGAFAAQDIFSESVPKGALEIEIFCADHTAYSKKLGRVVMMNEVDDHQKDDFILLSGTAVREMLAKGQLPPPEFSRPEVAQILMGYYQQ